jgi:hypothetical protein
VQAVLDTVSANSEWVPPLDKGAMYIRPLLIGNGPILGLGPAPESMLLVYVSPVGAYFKGGQLTPIDLLVRACVRVYVHAVRRPMKRAIQSGVWMSGCRALALGWSRSCVVEGVGLVPSCSQTTWNLRAHKVSPRHVVEPRHNHIAGELVLPPRGAGRRGRHQVHRQLCAGAGDAAGCQSPRLLGRALLGRQGWYSITWTTPPCLVIWLDAPNCTCSLPSSEVMPVVASHRRLRDVWRQ